MTQVFPPQLPPIAADIMSKFIRISPKKRSHQLYENKGPTTPPSPKRSHHPTEK
jgi:hypothetical protein